MPKYSLQIEKSKLVIGKQSFELNKIDQVSHTFQSIHYTR